jgi:hypothetical protein
MNIITITGLQEPVRIEVIDNPFTRLFIDHFTQVANSHSGRLMRRVVGASVAPNDTFYDRCQRLRDVVEELNDITGNFPYQVEDVKLHARNQTAQDLLNQLHRCFTTAYRCATTRRDDLVWSDHFPSSFTVPDHKFTRFLELLILLNDYVHDTELYVDTVNKAFCRSFKLDQAEIHIDGAYDKCENIRSIYLDIPEEHYQYFSDSDEYDVWVGIDILGKGYINAFWDHDDPSEWDVTHSLGITGKIYIETSVNKKSTVLQTPEFNKWLADKGMQYYPYMCGMPIGKVIENKAIFSRSPFVKPGLALSVN